MNSIIKTLFATVFIFLVTSCRSSDQDNHSHTSEYAEQEQRIIKTLSESDIEELKSGQGWGLAKTAELNGVPGPRHLLDMKSEINLSSQQVKKIEKIFEAMKKEAIPLGERFISLKRELNNAFTEKMINESTLKALLQKISDTHSNLRFVHLETHLQMLPILSDQQIRHYNTPAGL